LRILNQNDSDRICGITRSGKFVDSHTSYAAIAPTCRPSKGQNGVKRFVWLLFAHSVQSWTTACRCLPNGVEEVDSVI